MNSKTLRGVLIGAALAISAAAYASINYFPPPDWTWSYNAGTVVGSATGGLKGAGTINAQGLYVGGTAVALAGSGGTVTSVGAADGSGTPIFSWSAAVTTSGTLTETLVNQSAHAVLIGPSSGSAAQPTFRALVAADIPTISLTSGVSGVLPVANGGNGTATPTLTQGTNVTITGSWPNYTISATGGSGCTLANPTGTVGLTAVNGSATTCMRSDAAPALSQAITPTWSGLHLFSAGLVATGGAFPSTATTGLSVSGRNSVPALDFVNASAAANQHVWTMYQDGAGNFFLTTTNDANSGGLGAISIARVGSGDGVGVITLGETTDYSGIIVNGFVNISGNTNGLTMTDLLQSTNNKAWDVANFSGQMHIRPCNDAITSCGADSMTFTRSGTSPAFVGFGAGAHGVVYQFSMGAGSSGASSNVCYGGCGTPSASRSSAGLYTYTHNIGVASIQWTCSFTSGTIGSNLALYIITNATTANTVGISTINGSGVATDPGSSGSNIVCTGMYPG